jgi:acyl-CoA reductase-like NAD-dependent aldehyde dehydrogenase
MGGAELSGADLGAGARLSRGARRREGLGMDGMGESAAARQTGSHPAEAAEAAKAAEAAAGVRAAAGAAGAAWGAVPLAERLAVVRRFRRLAARDPRRLAASVARAEADTLAAEILPLLAAARFLERAAPGLLAPRTLSGGRPLWLAGVRAEVRREPVGAVLLLAPSNYPLMLAGVQTLQALAAGNAVVWKPAAGGGAAAAAMAGLLAAAGLPAGVLQVLDERAATGAAAAASGYDRIVLTGSARTGAAVLAASAATLTPCTMELSGNDPVFVLPGADLDLAARCLGYGLRLNAGATCIAPRRVFATEAAAAALAERLAPLAAALPEATPPAPVRALLERLVAEAEAGGAVASRHPGATIVRGARPGMALLREDVFAPALSFVSLPGGDWDTEAALRGAADCPYALGASVFGPVAAARALAARIDAGSVAVNDVIVPTADPRLPFGGRRRSGFGVTRGAEGLLEMTAIKTVSVRRPGVLGGLRVHLAPQRPADAARLATLIRWLYRW